ncbi:MAG: NUDIX hydrolase [Betaproteobacteria bacterium]|nr:NUDIX hydrolase [Betaproteobacteria bacterium]MBU6512066.1 NUDIX hydrolase [Betaproteobacteria bacterium]MDE1957014.1 NUDIX hydrolase [Betaproteobacteria bacterium]
MASSDPPEHEGLRETPVATQPVFEGRFLRIWRDTVRLPDGAVAEREYIKHSGAVMVIPLLDNGRVLMERQWRTPMRRVMTEFPAGKLDAGEAWQACAARELREETGYLAREWAYIGTINNAISYSDEAIHLAFARGLSPGPRQLDQHEFLEVFEAAPEELLGWVRSGAITDVKTVIGVFWLEKLLSGSWDLDWRS